ncbi:uncharacterized protein PB18E9.04c-like [Lactuca sativa]|uniref:uncharacterized protein PB18E9.04c-like n=1 Tax=Lactuca sativa TaxID=4236 RepID=UPI000CD9F462|nr:uncharacterized protein PB18E9.04c-like [Lactuca sativa]
MKDALVTSIASFHTKKIIISDPIKFDYYGSIPESMYRCVSAKSTVMADYIKLTLTEPRVLTSEQKVALESVDKPSNRRKRDTTKKDPTEEDNSKASKSRKRKSNKGDSSKPKKIKKMARRTKSLTPPTSETDKEDEEEVGHHESSRGNTPPKSPTPTEPIHDNIPTPPPSPKQTIPVSVPIVTPPTTSQPTTSLSPPPPVSSTPVSTLPLPPLVITQTTTTTIPELIVGVNVSDTGATIETEPPVITKPLSPTNSTNSGATLGGQNDEFDSTYFSPYKLPTDEDDDAPITRQHLQSIHEKLDTLIIDSNAYNGVALKGFIDTTLEQYTDSIDIYTKVIDASTSSCKKAVDDVTAIVGTTQIFLESLKGHADTNAAKIQDSVDSFSKSLQEEQSKFDDMLSSIQAENSSLISSVTSKLESLHANLATKSALTKELAQKSSTIEVQKVQLAQEEKEFLY